MNFTDLKRRKFILFLAAVLMLTVVLSGCGKDENTITIGSKNFTESRVLATLFEVMIEENSELKAEVKEFGGSQLAFAAIENRDIDVYPEYTGTGYTVMLEKEAISDADETYEIVKNEFEKNYNLIWLGQLGFNNTYTLTVRQEMADELGLETYSDLLEYDQDLILGTTFEFMERPDGYPGLQEVYGFEFKKHDGFDPGLTYSSVQNENVDVIDAFSTDGRIPAFDLVSLEDDKNFFPPYYAAPLVNGESLEKHPEIEEILSQLEGQISDEEMRQINYRVDEEGATEEQAAREFLESKGLI